MDTEEKTLKEKENQIKKLTKENDELENYFKNTIIPQLFIDSHFILRKFTPPAMKQFKLSGNDIGKSIHDVKDNFRFPSLIENIEKVIETYQILEKEIQTTDLKWYQMNIIPYISFENKKTNGVIITFVDITPRIKDLKEQELLISDHETLLDTISHDIKTPLTSLMLIVEQLKNPSSKKDKEFETLLDYLDRSVAKMHLIINELTDVGKKKHKYKAEEELVNFENILEDVRLTLKEQIIASGSIITSDIQVSEFLFVRRKLRSVIYNLINNAIKFKYPGRIPEIMVRTKKTKNHLIISVQDNGIGIEKSHQSSIFSKYFRIKDGIDGSGIGLYLVNEIVNGCGGKVSVKSSPGKGSEFKMSLKITGLK